jgi:Relaxase/Mobilisation nuclease domain
MIAKQIKGKSFRGVLDYLHSKYGSRIIGGNMAGDTPRIIAAEFAVSRQFNPSLEKAVYHSSLSLPKTEHLADDQWSAIADEYLKGMDFTGSQYVVYRHSDKDHDHVHIVASRIRITDGTTVNDSWDYVRSEKLVRELEKKYELTSTVSSNQKYQRGQTSGERRLIERTGEESVRTKLQKAIDEVSIELITMPKLINRLKDQGIDARVSLTRTGKIRGISYSLDGVAISGTHLGKAYTFPGLQKYQGISYDNDLHREELVKASDREPVIQTIEDIEKEIRKQIELAHQLQIERSLTIAPILKDYLNEIKAHKAEGKRYRINWQKTSRTLYLYNQEEPEPLLAVKYQDGQYKPVELPLTKDNKSSLTNTDVQYWQQLAIKLHQQQEQRRKQDIEQKKKQSKRRGLGL